MSPSLRRSALVLLLVSSPALAGPPRADRSAARSRAQGTRPEPGEVQGPEAVPIASAAADGGGIDLAGFLGMLTALAATYVYARGQRLAPTRGVVRPSSGTAPPDRR